MGIGIIKQDKLPIFWVFVFSLFSTHLISGKVDSLLTLVSTTTDTLVADAIYDQAKAYSGKDIDSSLYLAITSAKLSERLNYTRGRLNAYRGISAIGPRAGNNDIALEYIEKGLDLIKRENFPKEEELKFLINKGASYTYQNKLGEAIEVNTEAYDLARSLELKERAGLILNNMGVLYRKTSEYVKAIDTYKESILLRKEINDSIGMATSFFNLGATYAKIDSSKLSFDALANAKSIFQKLGKDQSVLECDLALGTAAFDLGEYVKAKELLQPLENTEDVKFLPNDDFRIHLYLAELAMITNELSEADRLLNDIRDIEDSEFKEEEIKYLNLKSELYEAKKDFKNALLFRKKFQDKMESLTDNEKVKFREEMEAKFQNSVKDYEIEQLEIQEKLINRQLKISRQRNVVLGIGTVLLGGFLWSLFIFYNKIKRKNKQISKVNKTNVILLKEIHHRVKNNLQIISSLLRMQARKTMDKGTREALQSSKARVQSMSILHQLLYQDDSLSKVNVDVYFKEIIDNLKDTYQQDENIAFHVDFDPISLDVDVLVSLGLIMNELVTNAMKYAFVSKAQGNIWISFKDAADSIVLKVIDDGVGLDSNELPIREGSLGMQLIQGFTNRYNGIIDIDPASSGLSISISFSKEELLQNYID